MSILHCLNYVTSMLMFPQNPKKKNHQLAAEIHHLKTWPSMPRGSRGLGALQNAKNFQGKLGSVMTLGPEVRQSHRATERSEKPW